MTKHIHHKVKHSSPSSGSDIDKLVKLVHDLHKDDYEELLKILSSGFKNVLQGEAEQNNDRLALLELAIKNHKAYLEYANNKYQLIKDLPRQPSAEALQQFTLLQEYLTNEYQHYCSMYEQDKPFSEFVNMITGLKSKMKNSK